MKLKYFALLCALLLSSIQLFSVVVNGFRIEGNTTISDEEIASMTDISVGEDVYRLDLQIAAKKLFESGYFSKVNLDIVEEATGNVLLISVVENPVLKDYSIKINGPGLVPRDSIESTITLERGKALSVKRLRESMEHIQRLYEESGYFLLNISSNVSLSSSGGVKIPDGKLVITIDEYAIWDVEFEPQLPKAELKYLKSKLTIPLYKDYASKPAILRFVLSRKDYYPTRSQFAQTRSNLSNVFYIGPNTHLSFEPSGEASNTLVMRVEISPPEIEGSPLEINSVKIEGNEAVGKTELEKAASDAITELGKDTFSNLDLGIVVDRVRRVYEKAGVLFVHLEPQIVNGGTLEIKVDERKLSKIELEGLTKTKPYLVEDYLNALKKGEVVRLSDLANVYMSLNATGYFESVDILPKESATGVELLVRFTESNKPRKFGGGITWTDPKEGTGFWDKLWKGLSGHLDFQIVNALGYGESLSTTLEMGVSKRNAKLSGSLPRVGGSHFELGVDLHYTEISESSTITDSSTDSSESSVSTISTITKTWGISPTLSYKLNPKDSIGLALAMERGEEVSATETHPKNSTRIETFFLHRDVDDFWYPTNGNRLELRYTLSGFMPSDTYSFQKLFLDTRLYWKLFPNLSAALRVELGTMWDVSGSPQPFSIGGSTTVRGTTSVLSGYRMWLANAELRWNAIDLNRSTQIYGVGFLDAGYAGETLGGSPMASLGLGIHLKIPGLGVLRLDFPYVDGEWKTSFGFGAMF